VTNGEDMVVGMQATPATRTTARTLVPALVQVERLTGTTPERCYVGRRYRGHEVAGMTEVVIAGRRRGLTPTTRRELRRRSARP
jgi:IS5 family transposase